MATYRQVLAIDDTDLTAMDALERLYLRLERWEPLKDVYAKKADLAESPEEKKRMLFVLFVMVAAIAIIAAAIGALAVSLGLPLWIGIVIALVVGAAVTLFMLLNMV